MIRFVAGFVTCAILVAALAYSDNWHSFYRLTWTEQIVISHARKMTRPLIIVIGHRKDLPEHLPLQGQGVTNDEGEVWACGWRDKARSDSMQAKLNAVLEH